MRKKYNAELNSRVIRVSLEDYLLLVEMSRRDGISLAQSLHQMLKRQEPVAHLPAADLSSNNPVNVFA